MSKPFPTTDTCRLHLKEVGVNMQRNSTIGMVLAGLLMFPMDTLGQCAFDLCGYWYSENYNSGVPVEYVSIDMVGDQLICTKVLGDPFVPTGNITWQGTPTSCNFSGEVFATSGFGQPIVPVPGTINIISEDHIVVAPFNLIFFRSNTGHLDSEGIDYSAFPVSCIECLSPFPNVFTPNADGVNDLLETICGIKSALFAVQDRWGRTVFESMDPDPTWDGRKEWTPCAEGTYFWSMIDAKDRTGRIRHGTVQLLR